MSDESLLQFPCDFPLKVMGRDTETFRDAALAIVERHAGKLDEERIRSRPSRAGAFRSVTFTITAESKEQLDRLYRELSAHEEVLIVL